MSHGDRLWDDLTLDVLFSELLKQFSDVDKDNKTR